ncbi:PAS-domain containing protein [Novosphingobium sp. 18052]|uniref:PAS-domain containing protein n=1 Tax=Novosphingobium sp. 18052 TaxID=2681400 RepID=UPI001F2BF8A8|nr:PAS-domain containing protein [Novosphingobium sp. 18052]
MYLGLNDEQADAVKSGAIGDHVAVPSLDTALQAASLAEKRLREAVDAIPQGIVFLDEEDRYILWNERYAEIYEKSADLLKPGVRLVDALRIGIERGDYPEAMGQEEQWLASRIAQLHQPGRRHEQRLSNGRCIMIEERRIEGGGTIGIRVDITDLKQKEETFRLLFELNPLPMLVYDQETGRVRVANEAAYALLGYSPGEMDSLPAHLVAQCRRTARHRSFRRE